jgi:hypothetical protein
MLMAKANRLKETAQRPQAPRSQLTMLPVMRHPVIRLQAQRPLAMLHLVTQHLAQQPQVMLHLARPHRVKRRGTLLPVMQHPVMPETISKAFSHSPKTHCDHLLTYQR